jgi:hypothetical protein
VQDFDKYLDETDALLYNISSEQESLVFLLDSSSELALSSSRVPQVRARNSHAYLVDQTDPLAPTYSSRPSVCSPQSSSETVGPQAASFNPNDVTDVNDVNDVTVGSSPHTDAPTALDTEADDNTPTTPPAAAHVAVDIPANTVEDPDVQYIVLDIPTPATEGEPAANRPTTCLQRARSLVVSTRIVHPLMMGSVPFS